MRTPNPRFWQGKRVCVTGGTGFLGRHLIRQLLNLNARVRALALPPGAGQEFDEGGAQWVFGDVCDPSAVARATSGCEVIFHTAGVVAAWGSSLRRVHAVHTEGTQNVLAAAGLHATMVHTSSVVTVGASRNPVELDEDSPFQLDRLRADYVHAKRAAEQIALAAAERGQNVIPVNPGYLIGPGDSGRSIMGRLCLRFWKGRVPLAPPGGFNFADVRDVATGHLLAAEWGRSGRRYILGGTNMSLYTFLRHLAEIACMRPRIFFVVPRPFLYASALLSEGYGFLSGKEPYPCLQHARLNSYYWYYRWERARRELGFRPRPFQETIEDTGRWFFGCQRIRLRRFNSWWMRQSKRNPPLAIPRTTRAPVRKTA